MMNTNAPQPDLTAELLSFIARRDETQVVLTKAAKAMNAVLGESGTIRYSEGDVMCDYDLDAALAVLRVFAESVHPSAVAAAPPDTPYFAPLEGGDTLIGWRCGSLTLQVELLPDGNIEWYVFGRAEKPVLEGTYDRVAMNEKFAHPVGAAVEVTDADLHKRIGERFNALSAEVASDDGVTSAVASRVRRELHALLREAPAASEAPYAALSESLKGKPQATDEPRIRHAHRSEGEASEAPADDLVRRLLALDAQLDPRSDWPFREAAKEIERLRREPTITREQFLRAVDAWRNSYGQKEKDATDDEIAYGLKHALAAAGITVAET